MVATLAQDNSLALDATFKARVEGAMMRSLMSLLAAGNMTSDQLALARKMVYDPATYAAIVAKGVVTETAVKARDGVQTAVTDTEIANAVSAVLARYVV
jgi:hypothetical protein